ncbi:MAG TPA: pyruvate kinase, partial [Terrimesophilobacter sp.]|nr:pyruvate kinase [Terrimesophilobacter sp.]
YDVHEEVYANVRKAADASGRAVAVLVDLQGPKIRLGKFEAGPYELAVGDVFRITTEDIVGNRDISSTTYEGLPADVKAGDPILIDDGKVTLRVTDTDGTVVTTVVEVPGAVSNNKGINLPGVAVNVPALSEKDEEDLRWGLGLGADLIALSFVRSADDIVRVHEIMAEEGRKIPVIAKIEKPQAVDNLEAIIDAFDGIMVARGDLGVELPLEAVPIVQKRAVELCRRMAKPVIVATQMLESMISSPRPTRAETSDVANAVLDGTDAVMLSGETSVGEFPVITVQTMARIIESTEEHGLDRISPLGTKPRTQGGAVTLAAAEVAEFVEAKYLCVFTQSGDSARRMSRIRSRIPMFAFTPIEGIRRRMALTWGIRAFLVDSVTHTDAMFRQVDDTLLELGLAEVGDVVVVISGSPPGTSGSTNDMRVHHIGDALKAPSPA